MPDILCNDFYFSKGEIEIGPIHNQSATMMISALSEKVMRDGQTEWYSFYLSDLSLLH
jgi:hypothetical protein